jgi:phenylglyoxylate dehydrogenase epsilon subunit
MAKRKHLIIGTGAAGLSALRQIRKTGSDDEVKLVTMEDHLPYSPMSLPYVVSGRKSEQDITIVDDGYFRSMNAALDRGKTLVGIDPGKNQVSYRDGSTEDYTTLLIATGSEPKLQPVLRDAGVPAFHVMDDSRRIGSLEKGSSIIILGAGFVGMELAVSLAEVGHRITVAAPRERVLRPYFDGEVDSLIIDLLARHGVKVELDCGEVLEASSQNGSFDLQFAKSGRKSADLVIAATGVRPRLSFLDGSGIKVNQGILVDSGMRTNVPGIFAAGDAAETMGFLTGQAGLSLIWPSAVEQGKIAGKGMVGLDDEYSGWLPMNGFNFFGEYAFSIGEFMAGPDAREYSRKDQAAGTYKKIVLREDRLIGANFINVDVDGGVLQYLIRNRVAIGPHVELLLDNPKQGGLWLMHEAEKASRIA